MTLLNQGDTCALGENLASFCKAGLVCTNLQAGEQELQGTCGPPRQMGEACNIDFECAAGLQCDAETPLETGSCVEAGDTGDACVSALDCKSFDCEDGVCAAEESEPICEVP